MKTEIRDIAFTPKSPLNKYNLWLHFKNRKPIMELWNNGKWNIVGGEGGNSNLPIVDLDNSSVTLETIQNIDDDSITQVQLTGHLDSINLNTYAILSLNREDGFCNISFLYYNVVLSFFINLQTGEGIDDTYEFYRLDRIDDLDIQGNIVNYMSAHEVIDDDSTPIFEHNNYDLKEVLEYFNNSITNTYVIQVIKTCMDMFGGIIYDDRFWAVTYMNYDANLYLWDIIISEKRTYKSLAFTMSGSLEQMLYLQSEETPILNTYNYVINRP